MSVKRTISFLLFVLLFNCFSPHAKSQNAANSVENIESNSKNLHQWGAVGLFQGLPSDRVRAVAQDQNGVMWFGTDRGLAKYDGRQIQTVTTENLGAIPILALKLAADNSLWIGTETGALRFYDNKFHQIPETANKKISAILLAPERGSMILTSLNGQIFECRQNADNSLTVETISGEPLTVADSEPEKPLEITGAAIHKSVLIAATHRRGLLHFDQTANVFGEITSRPRPYFVGALATDKNGGLWFGADAGGADAGLYFADNPWRPEKIQANLGAVTALNFAENRDLWAGTLERGAFLFRGRELLQHFTFENTAGGLRSNRIFTVFIDRESVVWFGTDRGAFRFDQNAARAQTISTVAESNFVRTLFQTRNGAILAGTNRGLFRFDAAKNQWFPIKNFERKAVFAIHENAGGELLVGTGGGFFTIADLEIESPDAQLRDKPDKPNETSKFNLASDSVRAIREISGKTHVATFGRGVERIENDRRALVFPIDQKDAGARDVTSLHHEPDKTLWIGTARSGVYRFDGKQFAQPEKLEALKNAAIRQIAGARETGVWFATDKGLFVFRNDRLETVLPGAETRNIFVEPNTSEDAAENSSKIWAATAGGLFRIREDQEFGWIASKLDVEGGLPSQNTFAVLPLRANNLLVGTNRGVVRYNANPVKPLLIATRVASQRLHQPAELQNQISLDYPQNSLAVEVAAQSSRTFAEEFQYAFSLRDQNGKVLNQKIGGENSFLPENLQPGEYEIHARGFNRDLESSEPLIIRFKIVSAPFPWTATALGVLLAFALVALVFAVAGQRKIRQTSRELNAARFDLANESERTRKRIARDLHDQTLADLRHLLMLADKPENGAATETKSQVFRSEIEKVSTEIRRICEDLSPSVLENIGFAAALEFALQTAAAAGKFEYEFVCAEDFEDDFNLPPPVQIQIYRIAQEVLNNIVVHAAATRVVLTVANKADFVLTIENNGRPFAPGNRQGKARGIKNIQARASLIEAVAAWQKTDGGATVFTLQKPNSVEIHSA